MGFGRFLWKHSTVRKLVTPSPRPKRAQATVGGVTHKLIWADRNSGWRYRCTCGWIDPKLRWTEKNAIFEGNRHVRGARSGGEFQAQQSLEIHRRRDEQIENDTNVRNLDAAMRRYEPWSRTMRPGGHSVLQADFDEIRRMISQYWNIRAQTDPMPNAAPTPAQIADRINRLLKDMKQHSEGPRIPAAKGSYEVAEKDPYHGRRFPPHQPSASVNSAAQFTQLTDGDLAYVYEGMRDRLSTSDPEKHLAFTKEVRRRVSAGTQNPKLIQFDAELRGEPRKSVQYGSFMQMANAYGGLSALGREAKESPLGEYRYWHSISTDGRECPPMSPQKFSELWSQLTRMGIATVGGSVP